MEREGVHETNQWFGQHISQHTHSLPAYTAEDVWEATVAFSPSRAVGLNDVRHRQVALLWGQELVLAAGLHGSDALREPHHVHG